MILCSIASGSSGNSIFVGNENTNLLIDAGISKKKIEEGLEKINVDPSKLDGILITHEHSDHIKGLGVMARKYHLPVYATLGTINQIRQIKSLGHIDNDLFVKIKNDKDFKIGSIDIQPFKVYHDAADPVAYRFYDKDKSLAILTDCGTYDDRIISVLKGISGLLLEANHDVHMLQAGSYPYKLKRRILSDIGHLSNEMCGMLLSRLLDDSLKHVMLGHLSKENNFAQLAYETVRTEIDLSESQIKSSDFELYVANRDDISKSIQI